MKAMNVKNWKELALNRKALNHLAEKGKATKGCKANGTRGIIRTKKCIVFSLR
jgi:hypothetical protein